MRRTIVTRTAVAILIGAAATPVALAAAQDGATQAPDRVGDRRRPRIRSRWCCAAMATARCPLTR